MSSLRTRLIAAASLWIALGSAAGGVALSYSFEQAVRDRFDLKVKALAVSLVGAIEAPPSARRPVALRRTGEVRFDVPGSGWYWRIVDDRGRVVRSASLDTADLPPMGDAPAGDFLLTEETGPRGAPLRAATTAVALEDGQGLRITVAIDASEVDAEVRSFDLLLATSLAILGLGLIAAVLLQVWFALRPLRRLRVDLARMLAGETDTLAGDYPEEVRPVVEAMNAVAEHDRRLIRRAREMTGNLAHALKTEISVLMTRLDPLPESTSAMVTLQLDRMAALVDHHQKRAAGGGDGLTARPVDVPETVRQIAEGLGRAYGDKRVQCRFDFIEPTAARVDPQDAQEIIGNLVENAFKYCREKIIVRARTDAGKVVMTVEDDGPGLTPEQASVATQRGRRLDTAAPGSGLGLAIVQELIELNGGRLSLERSSLGGLMATAMLPAASVIR